MRTPSDKYLSQDSITVSKDGIGDVVEGTASKLITRVWILERFSVSTLFKNLLNRSDRINALLLENLMMRA